jgi:hypothetical protein
VRRTARGVLAVLAAGSVALGFAPIAHAADESMMVTPLAEAWYQPNPSCGLPTGCVGTGALPVTPPVQPPATAPTSPYPARTMHIGFAAGQETARSYLALPTSSLTGTLSEASLDVPLDVAQADGSQSPETAKVQVCLVSAPILPADGSFDSPPAVSCGTSAPASYVATPSPHLHADLTGFGAALLTASGVALLPDATKAAQTDVWRVVFSAHDRTDAAKTPPATASLTLDVAEEDVTEPPTDSGLPAVAPPVGTGFAPAPTPQLPVQAAQQPTVVPPAAVPVALPRTLTVGYAYPGVWLLPLVFLVLVPAAARALTKDLTAVG